MSTPSIDLGLSVLYTSENEAVSKLRNQLSGPVAEMVEQIFAYFPNLQVANIHRMGEAELTYMITKASSVNLVKFEALFGECVKSNFAPDEEKFFRQDATSLVKIIRRMFSGTIAPMRLEKTPEYIKAIKARWDHETAILDALARLVLKEGIDQRLVSENGLS